MGEANTPVGRLLDVLPDLVEFDVLRQALRAAALNSSADEAGGRAWYNTVDRRQIAHGAVADVLAETETGTQKRLKRLYSGVNVAFSAVLAGREEERTQQLITLGETAETSEQWRDALAYYLLALGIARTNASLETRALVQRRVGRAALNMGDFVRAGLHYGASLATASTASDAAGQIIAATGLGNLASLQGRWVEAHDWYGRALSINGPEFARERAQLLVNQSMTLRERGLLVPARDLLENARAEWHDLTEADRAGWHNNMGLLLLATGDTLAAASHFERALHGETDHFHRAMVIANLSEVALRNHDIVSAQRYAREAESHALAHGSPRALAEVYLQMGKIAARRNDPNGVAFFELAIKLTQEQAYPLLSAEICCEYGRFRESVGEPDSARALYQEALQRYAALGATSSVAEIQEKLARAD